MRKEKQTFKKSTVNRTYENSKLFHRFTRNM